MGKQVKGWTPPEEDLIVTDTVEQQPAAWSPPADDAIVEPVKKKDSSDVKTDPSGADSVTPGERSSESGASKWEALGEAIKVVAPGAKPLYDFTRRAISGLVDDIPKAAAQATEVARSSVSPANVQEFIKTQRPIDFQKYVREKEGLKFYQGFDIDKYIAKYSDAFMADTGLQDIAKKIAENTPKVVERRAQVEQFVQTQKEQSAEKLAGTVQTYKDIKSIDDVLSFVGTMGGQAAYQIPLAIATRGASSLIQESAEVYDQQLDNIAKDKGISRAEVIKQNLDEPARGQSYAILAASLDAASAGNILKIFRQGATDGLFKRWVKGAVPETITEPTQGVLETVGGATGDKLEALGKAIKDPARIDEALGGLIGGSAGVFGASPAQTVEAVTKNVDVTDEQNLAAKAEVIQHKVEQQEAAVAAGDINAQPTTPINDQTTQAAPQPQPTEPAAVPETKTEEEVQTQSDQKVEETVAPDINTPQTKYSEGQVDPKQAARDQVEALVQSGDLKRESDGKVTVVTENGGKELRRIVDENKINYAFSKPSAEKIPLREAPGDSGAVGEGDIQQETPQERQGEEIQSKSPDQQQSEGLTFTKHIRADDEIGGIKGVRPENQFKLNQGFNHERVQIILDDEQAQLYQLGAKIKQATKSGNAIPMDDRKWKALEFNKKVNEIARQQRDKKKEVVLDFRTQDVNKPQTKYGDIGTTDREGSTGVPDQSGRQPDVAQPTAEGVQLRDDSGNIPVSPVQSSPAEGAPQEEVGQEATQGSTSPPNVPPKQTAATESERTPEERTTYTRIKNDPKVAKAIKQGIAQEAKEYIPRGLKKVTEHEADAIIDAKGVDGAVKMYLDDNSQIHPDVDTAIGIKLFQRLQKENKTEDAIRVFEKLSIRGTELGQAVNAYKLMQGNTMLGVVQKSVNKARQKYKEKHESKFQGAKNEIDAINEQAVDKVLKSQKFQAKVSAEVKKGGIKKAIDFLEGLKVDTKGKAFDAIYGLSASAWNTVISAVQKGLQAGLTISQAINKAVAGIKDPAFKKNEATEYLDKQLKDYRVTLDPANAIKAELQAQGKKIDTIIREHYSEQESTKKELIDKLISDASIPADQAQAIADELAAEFDRLTRDAKQKALNRILPKERKNVTKQDRKSTVDQLIEASNIGALSEEQYAEAVTDKLGVPKLTAEQLEEVNKLTDAVQKAKGDTAKSKAAQDLLNYVENLKGYSVMDAVQSVWYANILSGPTTWLVTNPFSNLTNLMAELGIDIVQNPKDAAFILGRVASGLTRGLIQAGDVLKTGYNPYKGEDYKVESQPLLERISFKGGEINPLNWLKYVTRAIKAGDILFYHPLKEQRLATLAIKEARKNGRTSPNKDDMHNLREQLIKEDYDAALQQASDEGFSGREQKIRAYEILEAARPELATKEAETFAARATFNIKPEGTLGQLAGWLNDGRRRFKPLNYVLPFVNTIMNVANEYMNYNPVVGYTRVIKGYSGWNTEATTYRKLTNEERARIAVKSTIGLAAMAALLMLDDPDDPESLVEITSNGTGDVIKNYELERNGWREYSIRIGKTWFSYKNTPLAMPLATVGFMKDARRYRRNPNLKEEISILTMGSFRFWMDMSTLSGLTDFFNIFAKDDISQYETSFTKLFKNLEKIGKSILIPNYFTQMSRLIQEFTDSPVRRADDLGESIYRDIPILRDNLDHLYDAFGDPVVPKQLEKFIPLNTHRTPEDAAMFDFLKEQKLLVGKPGKNSLKPNGTPMTEKEYNDWALAAAKAVKSRLKREYKMYSREKNKEVVKDWFDKVKADERKKAKYEVFGFF